MRSDYDQPLNLGQDRLISINDLADLIARIAGVEIEKVHVPGPQGVRGRNSDNTRLREVLGWEPEISLEEGFARTYEWIKFQMEKRLEGGDRESLLDQWAKSQVISEVAGEMDDQLAQLPTI